MEIFLSFCEVWLHEDQLLASIGSGPGTEILKRSRQNAGLQIVMQEPIGQTIEFRVRSGIAELTDVGPSPIFGDIYEQRGVWSRAFMASTALLQSLSRLWTLERLNPTLELGITTGWLEASHGVVVTQSAAQVRTMLLETILERPGDCAFVHLQGTKFSLNKVFSLVSESDISELQP